MILLLLWACGGGEVTETGSPSTPSVALAQAGPDVSGEVGAEIAFDGSGSQGVAFSWDFGDGQTAQGATVTHVYDQPGNYTAVLVATGEDGGWKADSVLAVAYLPAMETPPSSSSTLALEQGVLWAVTPEAGLLARIEADQVAEIPVCGTPRAVAADGDRVAVACDDDAVHVFDADGAWLDATNFSSGSHPVAVTLRNGVPTVALAGRGALWRYGEDIAEVPDPRCLAESNLVWASRHRSIDQVGLLGGTGATHTLAFDPGPDSDTTIRGVPNLLEHLLLSPDGGWLYSTGSLMNTARGVFRDGQPLTHETAVRAVVIAVDPATGQERFRRQLDDHGMAGAMALSPLGNILWVALPTMRSVVALDAYTGDVVNSVQDAGNGIRGLQVSADGTELYVHAWLDRAVRSYNIETSLPQLQQTWTTVQSEPLTAQVLRGKQLFWDASDLRMANDGYLTCAVCHPDGEHDGVTWDFTDRGEGLRNTTSLLGRGGTDQGRVHWSGNFDEIQDFEHDIRGAFGGTGFLSDAQWQVPGVAETLGTPKAGLSEDLDAMAAYVASLTETPRAPTTTTPEGALAFAAAGCDDCHSGAHYTDSSVDAPVRHDVGTFGPGSGQRLGGTLDGLDTPTLVGAWQTGPWLHDGSASTLVEAIERHDSAQGLDAAQVALIAGFVEAL